MTPEEVVERAYEAFAGYDLPPAMDYCTYCDTAEYERALHAPLRTLPDLVVWQYVMDAMHHTGDARDFLHFAPRVLADVLLGRTDDVALYLRRFAEAGWREWPAGEQRVVEDALGVLWERTLAEPRGPYDVEDVLCGIGTALGDLTAPLAAWGTRTDRPAVLNLAGLISINADAVRDGAPLRDAWWDTEAPPMRQVVAWLRDPVRRTQLDECAPVGGEGDELLATAAAVLDGA